MASPAREQARTHDKMQAPAGIDVRAFARLPDEIGHDPADMASLDQDALVRIAGECRGGELRGAEAPPVDQGRQARVVQIEVKPGERRAEAPRGGQRLTVFDEMTATGCVEAHCPEQTWKRRFVTQTVSWRRGGGVHPAQNTWRRMKNSVPAMRIAAGSVVTQASAMLRTVDICRPEPFAAMVPATPEDRMWVVETGRP